MTITSALNYINTSLKTAFANAVKVLSANTFKVKFPSVQKIEGIVKTDTADGFNRVVKKIEETKQLFGQKGIQVNNFPKIPTKIEISNFPAEKEVDLSSLEKKIGEINESIKKLPTSFPEFPKFPEIKIPVPKEIKFPEYPKFPDIPKPEKIIFPKSFSLDNAEVLISDDPKKSIPVRLTDGKEFYKAIEEFYQQVSSAVTFTNSDNQKTSALVDGERHVQVDVLSIKELEPTDSTKLNPTMTFSNVDNIVNSTMTLTKIIGTTSYFKTISYNTSKEVLSISGWSL